jgi:hypothetical protein
LRHVPGLFAVRQRVRPLPSHLRWMWLPLARLKPSTSSEELPSPCEVPRCLGTGNFPSGGNLFPPFWLCHSLGLPIAPAVRVPLFLATLYAIEMLCIYLGFLCDSGVGTW